MRYGRVSWTGSPLHSKGQRSAIRAK